MPFRKLKRQPEISILQTDNSLAADLGAEIWQSEKAGLSLEEKVKIYYRQFSDLVFRYLTATFGDVSQAEEITQEAFLRLYRELLNGQNIQNVKAWVFRVAHNLAVNQIKSRQFIQPFSEEAWAELESKLESRELNPEQNLLKKEKYMRLRQAIGRLTLVERQCLNLRTKGFRYREIAETLDISQTAVAETLYRVIEKLSSQTNE